MEPEVRSSSLGHLSLYFLARGIPGLIALLAIAVYTRLLAPSEYGDYVLVLTCVALGNALLFQWLRHGLLRFYSLHVDSPATLLSSIAGCYLVVLIVALTAFLALALLAQWERSLQELGLLTAVLLGCQSFFELNVDLRNARLEPLKLGFLGVVRAGSSLAIAWFLIVIFKFSAAGVVIGLAVGSLLSIMFVNARLWRGISLALVDRKLIADIAAYGLPLTASVLLTFVVHGADRLMIAAILDNDSVGLYASGFDLAQQSLGLIMMTVQMAYVPAALRTFAREDRKATHESLGVYGVILVAVGLPSTIILVTLAENISVVFLGAAFQDAARTLIPLIAVATLVSCLKSYYLDLAFHFSRRTTRLLGVATVVAVANVALNLWWIPLFGIYGAAYATIGSYAIGLGASLLTGRTLLRLRYWHPELPKVLGASILLVIALLPMRANLGVLALTSQVVIGLVTYAGALLVLNVFSVRSMLLNAFCGSEKQV